MSLNSNKTVNLNSSRIIFVVGNSRSGTTMMGRVFNCHDQVFTFKELHFFEEIWEPSESPEAINRNESITMAPKLIALQRTDYYDLGKLNTYLEEAQSIIGELDFCFPHEVFSKVLLHEAKLNDSQIACDQTPRNVYYIKELLSLYPDDVCVVNMVRDPRAIMLSQKNKWRGKTKGERKIPLKQIVRIWANYHPITMSLLWKTGISAGQKHHNEERVATVRFEQLTQNPKSTLMELCDSLNLDFQENMLNVPKVNSSNRVNQKGEVGIDSWVAERWRQGGLNSAEIFFVQRINGELMGEIGYEPIELQVNWLLVFLYLLTWPLKLILAFAMNVGRVTAIIPALKRRLGYS